MKTNNDSAGSGLHKSVQELVDLVRKNRAYGLPVKLAPVLFELERAIDLFRLARWSDVAKELNVSLPTLSHARKGAARILQKWQEAGVNPKDAIEAKVKIEEPTPEPTPLQVEARAATKNKPEDKPMSEMQKKLAELSSKKTGDRGKMNFDDAS